MKVNHPKTDTVTHEELYDALQAMEAKTLAVAVVLIVVFLFGVSLGTML